MKVLSILFRAIIYKIFNVLENIDIFDQTSIYARSRFSAWSIIIVSIPTYLQFVLIPSFAEIKTAIILLTMIPWALILIIFWLPLRGVNRKLAAEKRRLLKDVNLRIKASFKLLHSMQDDQDYTKIASIREMVQGLQIEREYLRSIRTWPWRTSTITGWLTAIVVPAIGSILVELIIKFIGK